MRHIYKIICVLGIAMSPAISLALSGEQMELQRLKDSVNRLQEELNAVQKQAYKQPISSNYKDLKGQAKIEAQLLDMQETMRDLNGRLEEVQYHIKTLTKRTDELTKNVFERLAELENNMGNAAASAEIKPAGTEASSVFGSTAIPDNSLTAPTETTKKEILELSPAVQYESAFKLLRESKYAEAEKALQQFIKENPDSALIENAYYWLGETYYARENYTQAGVFFMEGYQKYPKGNKAIDNLFKLALSLEKMGKKKEVCTTLKKLQADFPNMTSDIQAKVKEEKNRVGCS